MADRQSIGQATRRQSTGRWPLVGVVLCGLLCGGLGAGCHSMYHRARSLLPPEPEAQLRLRLEEARHAERLVRDAARVLRSHLLEEAPAQVVQTDWDRLEVAAADLERRAWAAVEAARLCPQSLPEAREVERLQAEARRWGQRARVGRQAKPWAQRRSLDEWLGEAASGAAP